MNLNPDFRDLLTLFNASGVKYVVVGAYALAVHGVPRFTGDIDLFVEPSPDNAQRVMASLGEFGFADTSLKPDNLCQSGIVVRVGRPPRQVDLITSISGVEFSEAWQDRHMVEVAEDLTVPFLSRRLLERNKQASGRLKDKADLDLLRKSPGE
jgi:hypothetical protein